MGWSIHSEDLKDAFGRFTDASEHLAVSYAAIEQRVAKLSEELAAARNDRLAHLADKERATKRLEGLLSVLPAAVVVVDAGGCVQDANPSAVELLGEPLTGELWRDVIARAFVADTLSRHDITLKNGRVVSVSTSPLGVEPGQVIVVTDVTEMRNLQELVSRYQRLSAIGEMAAVLAHQIRTPLASALLYASHLTQAKTGQAGGREFAQKLLHRLRHLDELISDILAFAKGGQFATEAVPLSELLSEVETLNGEELRAAGFRFIVCNAIPSQIIIGNRNALLTVLQNLLTNAVEACTEHSSSLLHGDRPTIQIEARLARTRDDIERIELLVMDNGPGIPIEDQQRIFAPFVTTRKRGTGLGLAVAEKIIHAHGGRIRIMTEHGPGTIVGIHLPLPQGSAKPLARVIEAKTTHHSSPMQRSAASSEPIEKPTSKDVLEVRKE